MNEKSPIQQEEKIPQLDIIEFKDKDGDDNIAVRAGEYTVFATKQLSDKWTINFALTKELQSDSWMDTMTGRGAFATMGDLKPAFEVLIRELDNRGQDWFCACDKRRAKLYSRYIPEDRIQIIEDKDV